MRGAAGRRAVVIALAAIGLVAGAVVGGAVLPAGAQARASTSDAAGIESLQRQLNALGCNAGAVDGTLGPNTTQAVRWFQSAAGIAVDGIVGVDTTAALTLAGAAGNPSCRNVPAPPPATAPPAGSAQAACTQAQIQAGVQAALLANEKMAKSGPFQCAGNLAFNAPTISSGGRNTQVIELLQWSGSAWKSVNRDVYCESGSVPKLIYERTCLAGKTDPKSNPGTSDAATVQRIQRQLNALGCNAGTIDGKLGPKTTAAVRWFQSAAKLSVDGIVGPLTSAALTQASARGTPSCTQVPPPPAPAKTTNGPQCTQTAVLAGANSALNAGERITLSGPFQCAGVWAYNGPTIVNGAGTQTQVTELLRWNGTAWQAVNRAAYCESGGIPAVVAQKACQVT
jgi:peptidoglycan hydrolase-like protein with peptidoglycan-binding domain